MDRGINMACDWSFLSSVISAASGLGGVWLGGFLTWKREADRESGRIKKESSYLAILVTAHLERFANDCVHVAFDDGSAYGRPASKDGQYYVPTVKTPTFDPLSFGVDWKVLPSDLMYEILDLRYKNEQLINEIDAKWEFADPPEYTDFFWARQYGYAELGLDVAKIAQRLREHVGITTPVKKEGQWDRDEALREMMTRISEERRAWEERCAAVPSPFSNNAEDPKES
ncbi:hypothetical protein [Herbaspirillum sp. GW103]|uniref:hypothetical protein n=1 Tax=Herbaspirillum sp. GW103 TaxID=1175306 RepID=UPI0006837E87|nr:hypothetical protein [Herbaspirillum sp. GW103]